MIEKKAKNIARVWRSSWGFLETTSGIWLVPLMIMMLAGLAVMSFMVISSLRVYIGGEGNWSRSQKDSINFLGQYLRYRDEKYFERYRMADNTPYLLSQARVAMERKPPDQNAAVQAMIKVGIDPFDAAVAVFFFPLLSNLGNVHVALKNWAEADRKLEELRGVANELHDVIRYGGAAQMARIPALEDRIWEINDAVSPLPDRFANSLGEEYRTSATLLILYYFAASLLLIFLSVMWARRQLRRQFWIQAALDESQALAGAALDSIGEPVITIGLTKRVQSVNAAAERLIGLRARDCLNRPMNEVLTLVDKTSGQPVNLPVDASTPDTSISAAMTHELQLVHVDGSRTFVQALISNMDDASRRHIGHVLVLRDMTLEQKFLDALAWQATHDALTGLVNRSEFERCLREVLDASDTAVLLMLDLDRFKVVNDTCGHAAGDAMLLEVTRLFRQCIDDHDVLGRLGGDEFGVLMYWRYDALGRDKAERLRRSLEDFLFVWEGERFTVSVSIGMLDLSRRLESIERAMQLADIACYLAKERGRNRIQMADPSDSQQARQAGDVQWSRRIKAALESETFRLYAQPIVPLDAGSAQVPRAEILLRMPGANGEDIVPIAYLPAAERYGMMGQIDRWVVSTVIRRLARLSERTYCEYNVNLSAISISDERFVEFVMAELSSSGLDPSLICFEVTETTAIRNLDLASRFMRELRELGCRFALDDFGAGMSSFSYLRNLPIDYLKIDGSFVAGMGVDCVSRSVVSAINDIAHAMRSKTVAEHVEDAATVDMLRALGVDYCQGYYFGRPTLWQEENIDPQRGNDICILNLN